MSTHKELIDEGWILTGKIHYPIHPAVKKSGATFETLCEDARKTDHGEERKVVILGDGTGANCYHREAKPLPDSKEKSTLLKYLEAEILRIEAKDYPIADTGDYTTIWEVEDCGGKMGYGLTISEALEDVKKSEDDETKWDYVPKECR